MFNLLRNAIGYSYNTYIVVIFFKESLIDGAIERTMRKIEAIVETGELGKLRDALREIGIKTMRVAEFGGKEDEFRNRTTDHRPEAKNNSPSKAKIGVVVPEDVAGMVILALLSKTKDGGFDDLQKIQIHN